MALDGLVQANNPRLDAIRAALREGVRTLLAIVPQLSRYSVVSVLALGLDFAVYLMLTAGQTRPSLAGVVGYASGLALHYLLSVRFVFDASVADKAHTRLFGEFALSGLVGMAITVSVIAVATDFAGLPALPAKILAAGASFIVVYTLRRTVVFARS